MRCFKDFALKWNSAKMNLALRSCILTTAVSQTQNQRFSKTLKWAVTTTLALRFQWKWETVKTPTWYLPTPETIWVQTLLYSSSCPASRSSWPWFAFSLLPTIIASSSRETIQVILLEHRHPNPMTVIWSSDNTAIEINWCELLNFNKLIITKNYEVLRCFMYLKRLALFVQSQRTIYLFPILTPYYADGILKAFRRKIFEHLANYESILTSFHCF